MTFVSFVKIGKPSFHNYRVKNLTCGLQVRPLAQIFDQSFFIYCKRNPLYTMQSLLLARREVMGDEKKWISLRPKEYPDLLSLTPYEQVAAQVYYIAKDIEDSLRSLPTTQHVEIQYEDMCLQPYHFLKKIMSSITHLENKANFTLIPEKFMTTNIQKVSDAEYGVVHFSWIDRFTLLETERTFIFSDFAGSQRENGLI
ncbi:sulfotransferase [Chloroflexi bacterium TSY]|nr:sulfotransferase [Chloroflexi bacterium TSY]